MAPPNTALSGTPVASTMGESAKALAVNAVATTKPWTVGRCLVLITPRIVGHGGPPVRGRDAAGELPELRLL